MTGNRSPARPLAAPDDKHSPAAAERRRTTPNIIDYARSETRPFGADAPFNAVDALVLAFRGTDDSFVGWKEDFNMAFRYPVPAQHAACEYVCAVARLWRGPMVLLGHSKGGNLAVYAAMNAPEPVQRRVTAVYSLDGPGFPSQIVGSDPYRSVMPLIVKIVPDSSIVGMILETPEPMRVVRSDQKGVMQHLTFSWQVSGNDFEYLPQVSPSSQLFNRSLNGWLESLSTEDREHAVDALFSVLRSSHADSMSEADRRHLIEAMGLLMAAVRSRSSR